MLKDGFEGALGDWLRVTNQTLFVVLGAYVPGRWGGRGIKIVVPSTWQPYATHPACELRVRGTNEIDGANMETWIAYNVFADESLFADDIPAVVGQWLRTGPAELENPSISLRFLKDKLPKFNVLLRAHPQTLSFSAPFLVINTWHTIVCNYKVTRQADGFARVWFDGQLVCDYKGRTIPPEQAESGAWKVGLYCPKANNQELTINKRVVLDDLAYSEDPSTTYEDIAPSDLVSVRRSDLLELQALVLRLMGDGDADRG